MRSTIKYSELPGALKKLAEEHKKAVRRGLLSAAKRGASELARESVRRKIFNTGAYARSWKGLPHEQGAVIRNQQPYSGVIEEGRRPGQTAPPPDAIEAWVRRKLGSQITQQAKALPRRPGVKRKDQREALIRQVTFLVGRKIAQQGIPAKRVLTDDVMVWRIREFVLEEVEREIRRAIEKAG